MRYRRGNGSLFKGRCGTYPDPLLVSLFPADDHAFVAKILRRSFRIGSGEIFTVLGLSAAPRLSMHARLGIYTVSLPERLRLTQHHSVLRHGSRIRRRDLFSHEIRERGEEQYWRHIPKEALNFSNLIFKRNCGSRRKLLDLREFIPRTIEPSKLRLMRRSSSA